MVDPAGYSSPEPNESPKHEMSDVQIRPIVIFLLALGLTIVAAFVSMAWMFSYLDSIEAARDVPRSPLAEERQVPPEPRLQPTSQGELGGVLEQDRQRLQGFRWIDRDAGVVQIPIERAIELIAQRGLPTRDQGELEN